jgi:alpha-galactosidase
LFSSYHLVLLTFIMAFLFLAIELKAEAIDLTSVEAPPHALWLDELETKSVQQDWGSPQARRSVDGNPLRINGVVFARGIGTHANSEWEIELHKAALLFSAMVGVDDEAGRNGTVSFEVWVDGKKAADSGVMHYKESARRLIVDLAGAKVLMLKVLDGGDGIGNDHADWAGAILLLNPKARTKPVAWTIPDEPAMPYVSGTAPKPRINGPRIVGTTPGRPFIFLVPATGKGPLSYAAKDLPAGLSLDSTTGIITGTVEKAGTYDVQLTVKGARGTAKRVLTIVAGDHKLALTPPMGWNSWNVWAGAVDDEKIRAAADAMVASGLAAHGYQYVNIDDCWEGERDEKGEILTNARFPNMKALGDYIHARGLRFGIYSSPGPRTCAGYMGSYQYETKDARTWAKWGVDYVKYDWCSYGHVAKDNSLEELEKPYKVMRAALDECGRDIVYSICQYGMGEVWKWGAAVGGNLWRTTNDINDTWQSLSSIGFAHNDISPYAQPGHWNDPDMLVVGRVGWGDPHASRLTPNEQITHITMWSLLAAPLLIGCDMSKLDQFTIDILSNDEVIDVDQDPLGKAATRIRVDDHVEVWARPLWDGTMAVGIFNRGRKEIKISVKWPELGLKGPQPVRNLWLQKDLGDFSRSFRAPVKAHGAMLIKVGKPIVRH